MKKNLFLLLTALALAGCTLAPEYARPAAPVPVAWPAGAAYEAPPVSSNAAAAWELDWSSFFQDPKLKTLIGTALTNNRDLRIAALNVEQARALYGVRRADLLPTVDAMAGGSKQVIPADLSSGGDRHTSERYDVNLGIASWEIDFFGRLRSLRDRSLQEYLATEQARRGAQVTLVSALAGAYLSLAADRETLALARTTLETRQQSYDLVSKRYNLGLTPELDLYRAKSQVETAKGDVYRFSQQVAQDENALVLLTGGPVPADLLPTGLEEFTPPREISSGLPSDVLLLRPDVLQAENMLRASYADIGAARAAFFPRISLTAAFGTASSDLNGLFKSGSDVWSFSPQAVLPIFDQRVWSAHKIAKVRQEIAVAEYEKAIQGAFREVADVLAVRGSVDEQVAAQEAVVRAEEAAFQLSTIRYTRGIDDFLSVLDAQRSLYLAKRGLVLLRLVKLGNQVRLYSVLGGGGGPMP